MASLMNRIIKKSDNPYIAQLEKSEVLFDRGLTKMPFPVFNIALSGDVDGGLGSGFMQIAGESKHFKTLFGLLIAKGYLMAHPDAILLFFDSEFGAPPKYFKIFGELVDRIVHIPVTSLEMLRHEFSSAIDEIKKDEKAIAIVDSIAGLGSKKEITDAIEGNDKEDLKKAKTAKSFYRINNPVLKLKNIPSIIINHTYDTIENYSKQVMSGGKGGTLHADNVWFIGRQQAKKGEIRVGWDFIINTNKSRFVKEGLKFPVTVLIAVD